MRFAPVEAAAGVQEGRAGAQPRQRVDLEVAVRRRERRLPDDLVTRQIGEANGRAARFEIGCDGARGLAFVEITRAGPRQTLQQPRLGGHRLVARPACFGRARRTAVIQEKRGAAAIARQC